MRKVRLHAHVVHFSVDGEPPEEWGEIHGPIDIVAYINGDSDYREVNITNDEAATTLKDIEKRLSTIEEKLDDCRSGATYEGIFQHLMVASSDRGESGRKWLQQWLKNSHQLTIVDPYLFQVPSGTTSQEHASHLISIIPDELESLTVLTFENPQRDVKDQVLSHFEQNKVVTKWYGTDAFHDRVWMKDNNEGVVTGTSFSGMGRRIAFILPLPEEDLDNFRTELSYIMKKMPNKSGG